MRELAHPRIIALFQLHRGVVLRAVVLPHILLPAGVVRAVAPPPIQPPAEAVRAAALLPIPLQAEAVLPPDQSEAAEAAV